MAQTNSDNCYKTEGKMISLIFYLRVKGRKIKAKWVIVTKEKINWNECND